MQRVVPFSAGQSIRGNGAAEEHMLYAAIANGAIGRSRQQGGFVVRG